MTGQQLRSLDFAKSLIREFAKMIWRRQINFFKAEFAILTRIFWIGDSQMLISSPTADFLSVQARNATIKKNNKVFLTLLILKII